MTFASRAFAAKVKESKFISSDEIKKATDLYLASGKEITKLPSSSFNIEEDSKDFINHYLSRCQGKSIDDEKTSILD